MTADEKENLELWNSRMTLSLIDYTLHVLVHRETNFYRNVWSFFVYMIPLRDLAQNENSRSDTVTVVNSCRYDSAEITFFGGIKHEYILAMRENWSGLTPPQIFPSIM